MQAFDRVFERYRQPIFGYVYRSMGGAAIAEELTQDVFLKAFLHLRRDRGSISFRAWIYRIATTTCIDAHRREARHPCVAPEEDGLEAVPPQSDDDPLESQLRREQQREVQAALHALPARHRQILALRQFQGLSYVEIGEVMGISVDAVTSLIHRARQAFRDAYRETQKGGTR